MKLNFIRFFAGNGMMGIRWAKGLSGFQIRLYFFFTDLAMQFEYSDAKKEAMLNKGKLKATVTKKEDEK